MKTDLTRIVMDKVVRFEKRRTTRWFIKVLLVVLTLLLMGSLSFYVIILKFFERNISDLFSLFTQDWDIISEFWQDTFNTIWDELPQKYLILFIVTLLVLISFILIMRKSFFIQKRKMKELEKYHIKCQN